MIWQKNCFVSFTQLQTDRSFTNTGCKLKQLFCSLLFSVNYLLIEALERYDYFFGETFTIECPTRSGNRMRLRDVALELSRRVVSLFLANKEGRRPCHGDDDRYTYDAHWNDLVLFYEYFHPETGRGCGARWVCCERKVQCSSGEVFLKSAFRDADSKKTSPLARCLLIENGGWKSNLPLVKNVEA